MDLRGSEADAQPRVRTWVKRCLIKTPIQIVSPASARSAKRDSWDARQGETHKCDAIDAVTRLAPFERFVLVMSILEQLFWLGLFPFAGLQHQEGSSDTNASVAPTPGAERDPSGG